MIKAETEATNFSAPWHVVKFEVTFVLHNVHYVELQAVQLLLYVVQATQPVALAYYVEAHALQFVIVKLSKLPFTVVCVGYALDAHPRHPAVVPFNKLA